MSKLTRKIKATENRLIQNKTFIHEQSHLLAQQLETKNLVLLSISCFIAGFIISRGKTVKEATLQFIVMPLKWGRLVKQLQKFLPYL